MSKVLWLLLLLSASVSGPGARAQAAAGVLVEMATHAGVIFSGEVISVARHDDAGFVEVQFHIQSAVRGCVEGGAYTLREWAGRWAGQDDRYRVGQRRLMLLTAPGPAGLSAPVYGADGAIPVVAGAAATPGEAGPAAEPLVDLRLLAVRAQPGAQPVAPAIAAPGLQNDLHNHLLIVGPIAIDGTASVFPALGSILALLRGGASAAI